MQYKYETHLHTCEASACGVSRGAAYISVYKQLGYDGIFVTDHFFGGNTAVSHELDWEERIRQYCSGYENALAEAERQNRLDGGNFKVFFGIEQTFNGDDYLVYGLGKDWLLAHPEAESMNHRQLFDAVNREGGLMIQAHPFRLRDYIGAIHLHPREVHGVEVYNGGNRPSENELAELYAKEYSFPVTSGSDIHNTAFALEDKSGGRMPVGGMAFDTPLTCIADYISRIKHKEGTVIR